MSCLQLLLDFSFFQKYFISQGIYPSLGHVMNFEASYEENLHSSSATFAFGSVKISNKYSNKFSIYLEFIFKKVFPLNRKHQSLDLV